MVEESLEHRCVGYVFDALTRALSGVDQLELSMGRIAVDESQALRPAEVRVRPLAEDFEVTDPVTSTTFPRACAPVDVRFSVLVDMWSVRASMRDAAADVAAWWQALAAAVAADRTLGGLVSHATPFRRLQGYAPRDAQYAASVTGGVSVMATIKPTSQRQE